MKASLLLILASLSLSASAFADGEAMYGAWASSSTDTICSSGASPKWINQADRSSLSLIISAGEMSASSKSDDPSATDPKKRVCFNSEVDSYALNGSIITFKTLTSTTNCDPANAAKVGDSGIATIVLKNNQLQFTNNVMSEGGEGEQCPAGDLTTIVLNRVQ